MGRWLAEYRSRFWTAVDIKLPSQCWLWLGARNDDGYGLFYAYGGSYLAHRVAYELVKRTISKGRVVRHRCDNPQCVNPSHLVQGTQADNVRDAVRRDRITRGERHGAARLSDADVAAIRGDPRTQTTIAKSYEVSQAQVSRIKRGLQRSHLLNGVSSNASQDAQGR